MKKFKYSINKVFTNKDYKLIIIHFIIKYNIHL